MLGLSKVDPSEARFSEIFASVGSGGAQKPAGPDGKKVSAWPILTFLALIFATPYLIMKLIGQVSTTALEECKCALICPKAIGLITVFPSFSYMQSAHFARPHTRNSEKPSDVDSAVHHRGNVSIQSVQSQRAHSIQRTIIEIGSTRSATNA